MAAGRASGLGGQAAFHSYNRLMSANRCCCSAMSFFFLQIFLCLPFRLRAQGTAGSEPAQLDAAYTHNNRHSSLRAFQSANNVRSGQGVSPGVRGTRRADLLSARSTRTRVTATADPRGPRPAPPAGPCPGRDATPHSAAPRLRQAKAIRGPIAQPQLVH